MEYFISDPNFNAKFGLKSIFLMLGPYGPPPLTTNGRTEDLDHLSVHEMDFHKLVCPGHSSQQTSVY